MQEQLSKEQLEQVDLLVQRRVADYTAKVDGLLSMIGDGMLFPVRREEVARDIVQNVPLETMQRAFENAITSTASCSLMGHLFQTLDFAAANGTFYAEREQVSRALIRLLADALVNGMITDETRRLANGLAAKMQIMGR